MATKGKSWFGYKRKTHLATREKGSFFDMFKVDLATREKSSFSDLSIDSKFKKKRKNFWSTYHVFELHRIDQNEKTKMTHFWT